MTFKSFAALPLMAALGACATAPAEPPGPGPGPPTSEADLEPVYAVSTGVGKLSGRLIILLDLERLLDRTAETSESARPAAMQPETKPGVMRAGAGGRG